MRGDEVLIDVEMFWPVWYRERESSVLFFRFARLKPRSWEPFSPPALGSMKLGAMQIMQGLGVEATNTRYLPMCQSDNTMATVGTQKCKSQYLFAYFNLHTTMRDTSLSLLLLTSYRLLATDVRPQLPSSSAESYLVQRRRSFY
jgi:hypothetical protein